MYERQKHDGGVYVAETGSPWTPALLRAWIAAAQAAGWVWSQRYRDEGPDVSGNLTDGTGYKFVYVMRPPENGRHGTLSVGCYGPDGIAVAIPLVFSAEAMAGLMRRCPECGATNVDTVRVGFANRACNACAPALRQRIETPGWTK